MENDGAVAGGPDFENMSDEALTTYLDEMKRKHAQVFGAVREKIAKDCAAPKKPAYREITLDQLPGFEKPKPEGETNE